MSDITTKENIGRMIADLQKHPGREAAITTSMVVGTLFVNKSIGELREACYLNGADVEILAKDKFFLETKIWFKIIGLTEQIVDALREIEKHT